MKSIGRFLFVNSRMGLCRAVAALALLAPAGAGAGAGEKLAFVGFDPASYSSEAQAGLEEIFSGRCFHNAMPVAAIEAMAEAKAPSGGDLGYDPDSPEGQYYSTAKMPSPPERTIAVSLGESVFERDGARLANGNCFSCHAGIVNGQVVAGLGNNRVVPSSRSKRAGNMPVFKVLAALKSEAEKKAFGTTMASILALNLSVPESPSRGDNFGPFAVWSVGARLADPADTGLMWGEEQTELTELFTSTMVPTVDPMPWWLMKYKERDYWYSDGGIYDAAHFSLNFTTAHAEANEHHAAHVASTAKALAFARETNSPLFPSELDADLVRRGADLFHGRTRPADRQGFVTCKTCHGSYTRKDSQPDLTQPGSWSVAYRGDKTLRSVGTDSAYNDVLQKFRPIAEHINKLKIYFEAQGTPELTPVVSVPDKKGYIAPPLVGVWSSAPYFHNGSVPTIQAVLNSKLRPEIWARNITDPYAYNLEQVGLVYEPVSRDEYAASAERASAVHPESKLAIDHESIYDTQTFGHANTGHTFGDRLTAEERAAVIEFLKSLSGPDM